MRYRYLVDLRRGISVFAIFSYGIAVLGTPQCPPLFMKPWALTICMENLEIPGRIQRERFTLVDFFRKKSNTFRDITFFPLSPKRPKFSVPFVGITSARRQVERKRKNYRYFVNGTIQARSRFRFQKNTSTYKMVNAICLKMGHAFF